MNIEEMREVVKDCSCMTYEFSVTEDSRGAIYLQGSYIEADTATHKLSEQRTRRWFLNPEMTRSEIVQTVFKCCMTSMEHRTREWFRYMGHPIFGPHFKVDDLLQLCIDNKFDTREETNAAPLPNSEELADTHKQTGP